MKSRWLQIVWKSQNTLETWNDYLKYNDHKNKIIKKIKYLHFKSQMHELSNNNNNNNNNKFIHSYDID